VRSSFIKTILQEHPERGEPGAQLDAQVKASAQRTISSIVVRSGDRGMTTETTGSSEPAKPANAAPNHTAASMVIVAPNWLGDAVMALPAIADVRRGEPNAHLVVAARHGVAALFSMVSDVDEVLTLDAGGWRESSRRLAGGGFGTVILLPNSFQAAWVASNARIPERWGYRTDWRGALLTRAVAAPRKVHQVEYYRLLAAALGFPNGPGEPRVVVSGARRAEAAALLARAGWDGRTPLVAIAPGAAYGGAKRWSSRSFGELARGLADDGAAVVMIGTGADRKIATEVEQEFRSRGAAPGLLDLVGATDLPMLAAVFAQCRALVTNDSGAMHLAAAVGTPVTALFGPTNERATRPLGARHTIIVGEAWCRPCMLRECPIDHRCMRRIAVAPVRESARQSL
jgi:heptosyltransferase-2